MPQVYPALPPLPTGGPCFELVKLDEGITRGKRRKRGLHIGGIAGLLYCFVAALHHCTAASIPVQSPLSLYTPNIAFCPCATTYVRFGPPPSQPRFLSQARGRPRKAAAGSAASAGGGRGSAPSQGGSAGADSLFVLGNGSGRGSGRGVNHWTQEEHDMLVQVSPAVHDVTNMC